MREGEKGRGKREEGRREGTNASGKSGWGNGSESVDVKGRVGGRESEREIWRQGDTQWARWRERDGMFI